MDRFIRFLTSSIGKKVQMALTGLLLCGFLITHLAGNLFLYKGPDAFNHYANALAANPLLPIAEFGLLALFLLHIFTAIRVTSENRKARPIPYISHTAAGGMTWGSSTMIFSGVLLLVFLVVHIRSFRLASAIVRSDLYTAVMAALARKWYAAFYVLAMGALGLHLSHGFQSGFQTMGVNHPRYTPTLKKLGLVFAALIAIGFASIAIWAGFLVS